MTADRARADATRGGPVGTVGSMTSPVPSPRRPSHGMPLAPPIARLLHAALMADGELQTARATSTALKTAYRSALGLPVSPATHEALWSWAVRVLLVAGAIQPGATEDDILSAAERLAAEFRAGGAR